jgi:MFS family permease
LTFASFLTDVSSEMVLNLLPVYMANVLGLGTGVIGLIEGVAQTTAAVLKIVSGWFSDRLGRRKWLTVAGYTLSTLAKPGFYWATSWLSVLALRFADRAGKGIRTAPRDALIADSVSGKQRGLAFGLHRAGDTAGAALGLGLAILLVWQVQGSGLTLQRETFQRLVLFSIVPAVLAVFILVIGIRERARSSAAGKQSERISFRRLDKRFYQFLGIVLLFTLGNSSDAFILLRAQERGVTILGMLGLLLAFNLIYAATATPAGAVSDRLGRRRVILLGWLAYSAIYLGLALADEVWHIWLLFAMYGLYYGLTEGTSKALVSDLVAPELRGSAYGIYNATLGIALFPASLLAGILWQGLGSWPGFGPSAPFLFGAIFSLFAALLFIRLKLPEDNQEDRD